MTREELIYTLLISEKAPQEDKLDSTTNNELQERIKHTRVLTTKLGNILTNKERRTISDELHRLETTRLTRTERERAIAYLITLKRNLENKQKYLTSAYHDQTYYGIKHIEHLFETIDDYYKTILVRFTFESNFEESEIRGDKHKELSLKEYITTITPHLVKLINKKWNSTQEKQNVQLVMTIIFQHNTNKTKKYKKKKKKKKKTKKEKHRSESRI